ncbi:hypothetical protein [Parabacteroides goldsteinii]|nr:hypothetical protein [Parabacteroides goldsteinii]
MPSTVAAISAPKAICVIRVLPGELLMLKTLRLVIRAIQNHN